jgi:glycosyltransferase involved in cell wall biosynthesis/O-antigen ligase
MVRSDFLMTVALPAAPATWRHCLTAALIGLVIPAGAFGSAVVLGVAAAALLAGLSVPDRARHGRRVLLAALFHPLGSLCCLMLVLWLPNLFASPEPGESALTWLRIGGAFAGATYLWSILDRNQTLVRIARDSLILGAAVILSLSVLAILLFPDAVSAFRHSQKANAWFRYKALASALACLIPLLAWMAWTLPGWRRVAALLAAAASLAVILGTGSRAAVAGSFAAMLVSLAFLAARRPRLRLPILVACGVLIVAVVAFLLSFYGCSEKNIGTRFCADAEATGALGLPLWLVDFHRQHIWAFIIERIPDRPWFGYGLNGIAHIPGADHLVPGLTVAFVPSHPHNWILEILAETGIAGFVPALLIVGGMIVRDALAVLRNGCPRRAARLALLCAFWGSACFNFSIWAPWWGVSFLFLMAVVSARPPIKTEPESRMLFVVTEDTAFLSHRLPMARAAKTAGYAVGVACAVRNHRARIEERGVAVYPWSVDRASTNPLREYLSLNALRCLYEETAPALVHHVAMKPVVYGAIAADLAGIPTAVNALIGLGFLFINDTRKTGFLRRLVLAALRLALDRPGARLLVQNPDDAETFVKAGVIARKRVTIIPGSGVDAERFRPLPEPPGETVVVSVVSRMLWDKGIGETVEAARILRQRGLPVRIRLVGDVDPANPQSIHPAALTMWNAEGVVEWKGPRNDIAAVWAESHVALLASYREGMPKALLEAAACGRPLVAADAPGCRSLVTDGENGLLVPVKNAEAIADALARLAADPDLRRRLGEAARRKVEEIYADPAIEWQVADLYRSLSAPDGPA